MPKVHRKGASHAVIVTYNFDYVVLLGTVVHIVYFFIVYQQVFEAERMVTRIGSYHRNCFSCVECNKKLDSTDVCEGPDNEIYCKNCYSLEYGTKARSNPRASGLRRYDGERLRSK